MDGNGKIKPEELRFIYKLILEGRNDSSILREYHRLGAVGELTFPLRTDESFIKDRRIELNVASEVLKDSMNKIMKPFMLKQREEHFAQLAEISDTLLENNLNTIIERQSEAIFGLRSKEIFRPTYTIYTSGYSLGDSKGVPVQLSKLQLIDLFRKNVENACKRYTYSFFFDCYVPHLKAEMPEMETEGFWPQVEKQPYEAIMAIKELAKKGELQGVCPVCRDLESQLPPFRHEDISDSNRATFPCEFAGETSSNSTGNCGNNRQPPVWD